MLSVIGESGGRYSSGKLEEISTEVRTAAEKIIQAKRATYYGIGMALARITRAIFGDENSVLTVSTMLDGQYGQTDVYAGVPTIVNRNGAQGVISLSLTREELLKFQNSCELLREVYASIDFNK